jgi:predicted  nucleic acid-binding Zn-ribbon protein
MSTAGKVLIVLVMLMTVVWIILSAGVSRLNTNANTRLNELTVQVEKLQGDVKQTQDDIASLLSQTSQAQEKVDREFTVLRAKQSDLEHARSQIADELSGVKYQLEIVQNTVKSAQSALDHRTTEQADETKELANERAQVQELIVETGKMRDRLASLRKDFQSQYHASIEMLGKASKTTEAQAGSAH